MSRSFTVFANVASIVLAFVLSSQINAEKARCGMASLMDLMRALTGEVSSGSMCSPGPKATTSIFESHPQ
jgi:hypothetical protein